jgi:hypothetical protein
MLAAIVPQGEQAWFFKLAGPIDAVAQQDESFLKYLKSIRFSGEDKPTPSWTLPEGWKLRSGKSGMRFATIDVPSDVPGADEPLELSVIPLPNDPASQAQNNLSNINRWRGQMKLPPIDLESLKKQSVEVPLEGATATVVNLQGHLSSEGMGGGAPFAGGGPFSGPARENPRTAPQASPHASPKTGITYKAPEGWTEGKIGGMRKAAFQVAEGEKQIEITVIDLASAAGERLPNVNRWRQQVALEAVTQEQLDQAIEPIPLGELQGDYVELAGPNESILGAIVDQGSKTWFIKLKGDSDLAKRESSRFKEFVKSLRFGENDQQ